MFLIIFFISLVSTYANNCDIVVRGDWLADGHEKVIYEGKLGDTEVVIKEPKIDNWRTIQHRFQNYASLRNEYDVLKSLEFDYPNYSMKMYDYCEAQIPFYIMERGKSITQDDIYKEPLRRMLQRNVNASIGMITTMDIKWNQLVEKDGEIHTIDMNMGDVHTFWDEKDHVMDFEEYYRMYIWQLYCGIGELETFSPMGFPRDMAENLPSGPMRCDNDPLRFKPNNPEDYVPNRELSYELVPDECTRVIYGQQIGQGAEKKVYSGTLDGKDVAIKKIKNHRDGTSNYHAYINLYMEFVAMNQYHSIYLENALKPYAFCLDEIHPYYIIELGQSISPDDREKYRSAVKDMLLRLADLDMYPSDFHWKQMVVKNGAVQLVDTNGSIFRQNKSLKKNVDLLVRNMIYNLYNE